MSFLRSLVSPAMEAEDITTNAENSAASAMGKDTGDGQADNGDISLDTDDILGTKGDNDNTPTDNDPTADPDNNPSDNNTDMNFENPMEDPNSSDTNDDNSLGEIPPENPEDLQTDDFEKTRKKKLWKQCRAFYDVIQDAIELITKYIPNMSDATTIKVLEDIKDNLINAKTAAFNILTMEYNTLGYEQMQKKYSALLLMYDAITDEMEKYFDQKEALLKPKKRQSITHKKK